MGVEQMEHVIYMTHMVIQSHKMVQDLIFLKKNGDSGIVIIKVQNN